MGGGPSNAGPSIGDYRWDRTVLVSGLPLFDDPVDVYELEKALYTLFADYAPEAVLVGELLSACTNDTISFVCLFVRCYEFYLLICLIFFCILLLYSWGKGFGLCKGKEYFHLVIICIMVFIIYCL